MELTISDKHVFGGPICVNTVEVSARLDDNAVIRWAIYSDTLDQAVFTAVDVDRVCIVASLRREEWDVSYYNVLITLNSQENLINGFHSQGKVTLGDDTIKVFKTSVINEEGKNYVFINRDGILDKVEILIQQEDGEYVIVESGLNANDVVMKNPTSETKAGVKVE